MRHLTRREFLKTSGVIAAGLACHELANEPNEALELAAAAVPSNILLVTADDLGVQVGCYGDPVARTPRLNALAGQGVRFTRAYVTQVSCSPSRASLYTGRYPHQTGYFPPDHAPLGQIGIAPDYAMDPSVTTVVQHLARTGYYIGRVGKLHVLPTASFPWAFTRNVQYADPTSRDPITFRNHAASFLDSVPAGRRWFLHMSFVDPHHPYMTQVNGFPANPVGPGGVRPFPFQGIDTAAVRERLAGYYNGVMRFDAGLGMLLDLLTRRGLAPTTLVIVLGDHGPGAARAKVTCYEAGLRIPLIVRWPGRTVAGIRPQLVSTLDIMPTMLQAAGLAAPAGVAGRSLLPLLQGQAVSWRGTLAAEYTSHERRHFYPRRSIRGRRYKYILNLLPHRENPEVSPDDDIAYAESRALPPSDARRLAFDRLRRPPAEELYDLNADPWEMTNLAGSPAHADQLRLLRDQLRSWRVSTDDPLRDLAVLRRMECEHYAGC